MIQKYIKDFESWNNKKVEINNLDNDLFFNEGEVWWCSIGVNIGVEIDGKNNLFERPVVILKKINLQMAIIAPLTNTYKDNVYIYKLESIQTCVALSHMRSISNKRLLRKFGRVNSNEFIEMIIRIKYIFTSKNETPTLSGGISEP